VSGAATPRRPRAPLDLTKPATVRAVARRSGLTLKRRLSQNLLVDPAALAAIVEALDPGAGDDVLEIGAGIGTLTVALAARAHRVVALEVDEACLRATAITLRGHANAIAVRLDVRQADPDALGLGPDYLAAGNIPYHLTGAILTRLLEEVRPPLRAVFLVQREVAARLTAPAGDWSLATVAVRSLATVERVADLPPSAFEPPPAVHSSILRLVPSPVLGSAERRAVLEVARAAFQMRRKTLRHGVTRAAGGDAGLAAAALEAAGLDAGRRPGTLDLDEWRALATALEARRRSPAR